MLRRLLIVLPLLAVVAAAGLWFYVNQRTRTAVDARIEHLVATGEYEEIAYDDLRVGFGGTVRFRDLRVVNALGEFMFDTVTVSNIDYANAVPRHVDFSASGLSFPSGIPAAVAAGDNLFARYLETRLDENPVVPLQVDYDYNYDPDDSYRLDSDLRLALPDAFVLQATSLTRNLDLQAFSDVGAGGADPLRSQLDMNRQLGELEIDHARVVIEDQGLNDALLELSSQDSGVAPEEMRRLLVTQARNLYLFTPQNLQSLAMEVGNQLAEYLEGGRTLTIGVEPAGDGRFATLQQEIMGAAFSGNLSRIPELLGLQISTQ